MMTSFLFFMARKIPRMIQSFNSYDCVTPETPLIVHHPNTGIYDDSSQTVFTVIWA